MRAVDIIINKRDHQRLTREEIQFFIHGLSVGDIPDYQVSAWAMAILLNGMDEQETTDLTLAMAASGEQLDMANIAPIVVDKHSTGGVGDKTTLVVAPIVSACGLPVGKMSGRGLGFSGGTIDKMETIPGYRVNLSKDEFLTQLKNLGIVLTGQSADLAPADGKLYALRDVTGTVPSMPLIASSIMSKKIASGAHVIVLDVKVGEGAFMPTLDDARELAALMVSIGKLSGRKVCALISDMNQPLGQAVGNANEVKEAIETLHGRGPSDFREHCLEISAYLLYLGKKANSLDSARELARNTIKTGDAFLQFKKLVEAQGGDISYLENPNKFPVARLHAEVISDTSGFLCEMNARVVGETAVMLGAGRAKKSDIIDPGVGIEVLAKVGDSVKPGQILFQIFANNQQLLDQAVASLKCAVKIQPQKCDPLPLFYDIIGGEL